MSLVEMARSVREGEASPVDLVAEALERAEAWQPVTNAFSSLHGEEAVAEARDRASEAPRGPLHGVPVAVKDLFDVRGWETTGCCDAYLGRVAREDSAAVRRLREAGAVIIGKTNQHELAAGATNMISACGPTRNPWDPDRITGGSSGGSAAAVASGVVPLALGTDTGGSIRIPAALCGVTGLKPTFGAVSAEGVMPLAPSMDTVGPLVGDAGDAALALSVLADGRPAEERSVQGLRIAVLGGIFEEVAATDVLQARDEVVDVLAGTGASAAASPVEVPYVPDDWERVGWAELFDAHGALLETGGIHPWTRAFMEAGKLYREGGTPGLRERNAALRDAFLRALTEADVLLAPTTPTAAIRFDQVEVTLGDGRVIDVRKGAVSLLTRAANMAGLPALGMPAGLSREGLPIGVQLIGAPGSEPTLLAAARGHQAATDHRAGSPPLGGRGRWGLGRG